MVMSRAHEESKIKSYRVKESWATKRKLAAQGKHIKVKLPSWLESKGEQYFAIPEKAEVIKKIFTISDVLDVHRANNRRNDSRIK